MCEESSLECCRVKWEGREFSFISSIAVSPRHMICCNPADVREGFASTLCLLLLSWLLLSVGSGSKCNQPPLLVLLQGASCLQGSLCQCFVAIKAAAAERNPHLQAVPSILHTAFTVTVSTTIYFPWSLCCYFIICCLLQGWKWCGRAALGVLSGV